MATRGNWNDVWSNFDQRRKAKAGEEANEGAVAEDDGEDMFKAAGIAAEYLGFAQGIPDQIHISY